MKYVDTVYGENIPEASLGDYLSRLTGRFFKILPLREQNYSSLDVYLERFRKELVTNRELFDCLGKDGRYINLIINIEQLQRSDCTLEETKNLVFDAINICKSISKDYGGESDV